MPFSWAPLLSYIPQIEEYNGISCIIIFYITKTFLKMLPIIIKICIQFSKMLNVKKKCVMYVRIEKCDVFLFSPFSTTLFKGKMQLCVLTSNLLPFPQSSRWHIDWLTEDPDNIVKTKNKEWTSHVILLASVYSSIKWKLHFSFQHYYEH